ncbi:MAG: acetate/propionate family kinase [Rhodocyclaceae bacterium]
MKQGILTINAGSSSIKFAVFELNGGLARHPSLSGQIDGIGADAKLIARNASGQRFPEVALKPGVAHKEAFDELLRWLGEQREASRQRGDEDDWKMAAVGHRVVHGGELYSQPMVLTPSVLAELEQFIVLAPLHQPHNLAGIKALSALLPDIPQIACFDTAFHRTQPRVAQLFAIPKALTAEGVKRYGFHGLSYEYIARVLPDHSAKASGRVVVAHLGNGASMCAMVDRRSQSTSMGFTAIDGLMMGTRTGALDPGVLLYLLENKGMGVKELTNLLYKQSGLLGVSGISQDMRTLLASDDPAAADAVELFCYRAITQIGALAAAIGGIDALVFTGGIGEHAVEIRRRIVEGCAWLGIELNAEANAGNRIHIGSASSRVEALVIPTDEEWMIADHTRELLAL